jgi:hypothetical protein
VTARLGEEPRRREPSTQPHPDFEGCAPERRVVLIPVGTFDRRTALAARYARLVPARERRAVHVAVDPTVAHAVGIEWMRAELPDLALEIVDDTGGIPATIASTAQEALASGADEVVVLVGQLSMQGVLRRLLHDGTAGAIAEAVGQVPGALSVLLQVAIES